jgi:hypothetical protein
VQFLLLLQNFIVIAPNDCELVVVVHTKILETFYYSFEMLLPLLSCARMLESKVDIHVVKLHKGDKWDWQVVIELFGKSFIWQH